MQELLPEIEIAAAGNVNHHLTKLLKDNKIGR